MLPLNLVRHFSVRRDMNSRISLINPTKKFLSFLTIHETMLFVGP